MHRSSPCRHRLSAAVGSLVSIAVLCTATGCGSSDRAATSSPPASVAAAQTTSAVAATVPDATAPAATGATPAADDTTTLASGGAVPAGSGGGGTCHVSVSGAATAEWDGTGGQLSVTSGYWLTAAQRTQYEATLGSPPQPILLNCAGSTSEQLVTFSADDESALPFAPGDYPVKVVGFVPGVLGYVLPDGQATVHIDAFDDHHIAGTMAYTETRAEGAINVTLVFDFDKPI